MVAGDLRYYVHPHLEHIYGRVDLGAHRLDSPGGFLRYACAFANEEESAFRAVVWAETPADEERAKAILPELTPDQVETRRAEIRQILDAAVHGGSTAFDFERQPEELLQSVNKRRERGIDWIVSVDRGVGDRVYGKIWLPDAFVSALMSMLLNEKHRAMLCRCRYDGCQRFFVAEQKGKKPRTEYCSDECMDNVNAAGSAARQRDRYKRQRAVGVLLEKHRRTLKAETAKQAVKQAFKSHRDASAEQLAAHAEHFIDLARKQK